MKSYNIKFKNDNAFVFAYVYDESGELVHFFIEWTRAEARAVAEAFIKQISK